MRTWTTSTPRRSRCSRASRRSSCRTARPGSCAAGAASSRPARATSSRSGRSRSARRTPITTAAAISSGRRRPRSDTASRAIRPSIRGRHRVLPRHGRHRPGGVDVALLPVAGWGARLPPGHLDPLAAARALELLAPQVAVPIHWGTLAPVVAGRHAPGHSESRRTSSPSMPRPWLPGGRHRDPARRNGRALGRSVSDEHLQRHDHEAERDVDRNRDDRPRPAHALAAGVPEPLSGERHNADPEGGPDRGRLPEDADRSGTSASTGPAAARRIDDSRRATPASSRRVTARPCSRLSPRLWAYTCASQSTTTVAAARPQAPTRSSSFRLIPR